VTGDDDTKSAATTARFTPRPRGEPPEPASRPSPRKLLAAELEKIEGRLQSVQDQGRSAFSEGSASFDRATVAVLRLAALFEDDEQFVPLLASASDVERRGIAHTRNIAAHLGYASMDEETIWVTATRDMPAFIAKIRAANGI
jgi:hypothetical protein